MKDNEAQPTTTEPTASFSAEDILDIREIGRKECLPLINRLRCAVENLLPHIAEAAVRDAGDARDCYEAAAAVLREPLP